MFLSFNLRWYLILLDSAYRSSLLISAWADVLILGIHTWSLPIDLYTSLKAEIKDQDFILLLLARQKASPAEWTVESSPTARDPPNKGKLDSKMLDHLADNHRRERQGDIT